MKRVSLLIVMAIALFLGNFSSASANQIYYVQAGDSLFNIANYFGVTVEAIVEANQLPNANTIKVGQGLIIPFELPEGLDPSQTQLYSVQAGDTMFSIARRWGIPVDDLIAANPSVNPHYIYIGQQLVVPIPPPAETPEESEAGPIDGIINNDEDAPQPFAPTEGDDSAESEPEAAPEPTPLVHIVAAGETLGGIADYYAVDINDIMAANGIVNPDWISVGQGLIIPGIPGTTVGIAPVETPTEGDQTEPDSAETPIVEGEPPVEGEPTAEETPAVEIPIDIYAGHPVGQNLLPNGSFEEGHYNAGGLAELQVPNGWNITWEEGENEFDNDYLRPETRVLSREFLPPEEHDSFIFDGDYTVKVFKGYAPLNFNLLTQMTLEPGIYELQVNVFPDLVTDYADSGKIYSSDGLAGEIRLFGGESVSIWQPLTKVGEHNIIIYRFAIESTGEYIVGANMRARYGLLNNGFFMDDWKLQAVQQ